MFAIWHSEILTASHYCFVVEGSGRFPNAVMKKIRRSTFKCMHSRAKLTQVVYVKTTVSFSCVMKYRLVSNSDYHLRNNLSTALNFTGAVILYHYILILFQTSEVIHRFIAIKQ